jgi:hypothetical protein
MAIIEEKRSGKWIVRSLTVRLAPCVILEAWLASNDGDELASTGKEPDNTICDNEWVRSFVEDIRSVGPKRNRWLYAQNTTYDQKLIGFAGEERRSRG